jgi:serine/threonine protein kinase
MGEVYRARDTRLDRIVAVKVLTSGLASDQLIRERFEREARTISSLNHPNICVLFDIGRERPANDADPVDFLVMEYLEGETLAARLARGPARATRAASATRASTSAGAFSGSRDHAAVSTETAADASVPPMTVEEALGIAIQIASALDRAHRQGIVHRDLKPGNVMLVKAARPAPAAAGASTSTSHVKLLDFGLARLTRTDSEKKDGLSHGLVSLADLTMPTMSSPLTMKGTILGTLQYMSPEQLEGKDIDARADIFAFGAVLYEMLTGRRPFDGKSQASLIGAILDHDPPPVASLQPATPALLTELVARCLAKDPEERWQSSRDLVRQLELIAAHGRTPSTSGDPAGTPIALRGGWLRTIAAALASAAIAGVVAAWVLWPKPAPSPVVSRFAFELPEGQAFTRSGRHVLALSPDGSRLVYVANKRLYLRNLNELSAAPISGTSDSDPSEPVFSPDGQWVAYWSNGGLKKVPVSGGAPLTLSTADNPLGIAWAGDRIVMGQTTPPAIIDVPAGGGSPKTLVTVDASKEEVAQSPQLLADGRAVLFTLRTGTQAWDDASIVVQDQTSGRRTVLVAGGTDGHVLPSGHLVYAQASTLYATRFDSSTLTVDGAAVPIQADVAMGTGGFTGAAQMAWSNAGSLAFNAGGLLQDRNIISLDRQGRSERAPLPNRRYQTGSSQMRVSPDGTRVALTIVSDGSSGQTRAGQDIWLWEIARGTLTRLTFDSRSAWPAWTPDGKRVCYASEANVLCQASDGSGQPQPMLKVPGPFGYTAVGPVTPDGQSMLLGIRKNPTAGADIVIAALGSSGDMRPLIKSPNNGEPAISPDGKWIAYSSSESGRDEVYVRPFPNVDGGRWQISSEGGAVPAWAPSGRELFYLEIRSAGAGTPTALMSVPVQLGTTFSGGKPQAVVKLPTGVGTGFALAPDGRFLFNVPALAADGEAVSRARIVVVQNWFEELKARVPNKK